MNDEGLEEAACSRRMAPAQRDFIIPHSAFIIPASRQSVFLGRGFPLGIDFGFELAPAD
jgi:hypothetical protein